MGSLLFCCNQREEPKPPTESNNPVLQERYIDVPEKMIEHPNYDKESIPLIKTYEEVSLE